MLQRFHYPILMVLVWLLMSCSDAAKESAITSDAIQLTSPAHNSKIFQTDLNLIWSDPAASQFGYRIQIARDEAFSNVVFDDQLSALTAQYTVDSAIPVQELYWRVSRIEDNNTLGEWTSSFKVTVVLNSVGLSSPIQSQNINTTAPLFQWQPNEFAQRYLFRLYSDSGLTQLVYSTEVTTNQVSLPPSNQLPESASQAYYWQVVPIIDGVHGVTSDTETFIVDTVAPAMVTLNQSSGDYNIASQFDTVSIASALENNARVLYTFSDDGTEPADPNLSNAQEFNLSTGLGGVNLNGTTIIKLAQVDAADNISEINRYEYRLDTTPPGSISADKDSGQYNIQTGFNQIVITGIEPGGSAWVERSNNDAPPADPTAQSPSVDSVSNTISNIDQNGITKFKILPVDAFGNPGQLVEVNYDLDTTAPVIDSILLNSGIPTTYQESISLSIRATDSSDFVEYQVINSSSTTSGNWYPFRTTVYHNSDLLVNTNNAQISLEVRVKDGHGNLSAPITGNLTLQRTLVTDNISTSATWTAENSPYLIRSNFQIAPNSVLTINDNTEIYVDQASSETNIEIAGALVFNSFAQFARIYLLGSSLVLNFTNPDPSSSSIRHVAFFGTNSLVVFNAGQTTSPFIIQTAEFISTRVSFTATNVQLENGVRFYDSQIDANTITLYGVVLDTSILVALNIDMLGSSVLGDSHINCLTCNIIQVDFLGMGFGNPLYVRDTLYMETSRFSDYADAILIDFNNTSSTIISSEFTNIQFFYVNNMSSVPVAITGGVFDDNLNAKIQGPFNHTP